MTLYFPLLSSALPRRLCQDSLHLPLSAFICTLCNDRMSFYKNLLSDIDKLHGFASRNDFDYHCFVEDKDLRDHKESVIRAIFLNPTDVV